MACCGFSLARFQLHRLERQCEKLGLRSQEFRLDDLNATIHCWVPDPASPRHDPAKPALILIHGFAANGIVGWERQLLDLGRYFALFVPDLLFFGGSFADGGPSDADRRSEFFQARCLIEVLRRQGVAEAAAVGTSYGGFVAFRMAELAPELVSKVVIASSGVCMTPSSNDPTLAAFGASHIHEVLMPVSVKLQKKSINLALYKPIFLPECIVRDFMEVHGGSRKERIELLDGLLIGSDKRPPLPKLKQEVLVLTGSDDRMFHLDLAKELHEHLGQKSRLVVIDKTGHVPQMENPKEFNKHVLAFLQSSNI